MASVPQFYSDHSLFYDNYGFPTSTTNQKFTTMMMMQQLQGTTTFDDFQESNYNYYDPVIVNSSTTFLPESSVPTISSSFFPERFGIGDHNNNNDCNMDVPSLTLPHHQFNMNNNNNNSSSIHLYNGNRSYNETFLQVADRFYDFGDEFSSDCKTTINTFTDATGKNWGNQKGVVEDTILKVGRYSMEERKDRILKYLKKRNQRNFNKTIKYACRKTLADRRVRVRGRFARNNIDQVSHEDDEEEVIPNNNNNNNDENINNNYNFENKIHQNLNLFSSSATTTHAQIIKHDHEEDWLQEAMSHLMCFPYTVG